jgi:hypothetical protein
MSPQASHDPGPAALSNEIAELQTMASAFSQSPPALLPVTTLQVVVTIDAARGWRLIETMRSASGRRRQMLCFDSREQIRRALEERLAWQRADGQFVATNMATPGGLPGVTSDWVHSKDFDLIFGPTRDALRKSICTTSAQCTVALPVP